MITNRQLIRIIHITKHLNTIKSHLNFKTLTSLEILVQQTVIDNLFQVNNKEILIIQIIIITFNSLKSNKEENNKLKNNKKRKIKKNKKNL